MPFTLTTLEIIAPYALAMALVGLLESLLTAKLVDDITDTHSHKTREAWGQGAANVITEFFGGMGGCAMTPRPWPPSTRSPPRTSAKGKSVEIVGLNDSSAERHERLSGSLPSH